MTETLHPHHVPSRLRRNPVFLGALAVLIVVPALVVFYLPSVITNIPDWMLLLAGWLGGLICLIVADEVWVHEERKVIGASHTAHVSHRLVRDPLFLAALVVLVFGPAPIAFYGPQAVASSPDWLWLIVAWVVALLATMVAFWIIGSQETVEGGTPG